MACICSLCQWVRDRNPEHYFSGLEPQTLPEQSLSEADAANDRSRYKFDSDILLIEVHKRNCILSRLEQHSICFRYPASTETYIAPMHGGL